MNQESSERLDGRLADGAPLPELLSAAEWVAVAKSLNLTPRQTQIAWLVCRGFRNTEIAGRLALSIDTVRAHIKALYGVLGVPGRTGVPLRLYSVARGATRSVDLRLPIQAATMASADLPIPPAALLNPDSQPRNPAEGWHPAPGA